MRSGDLMAELRGISKKLKGLEKENQKLGLLHTNLQEAMTEVLGQIDHNFTTMRKEIAGLKSPERPESEEINGHVPHPDEGVPRVIGKPG